MENFIKKPITKEQILPLCNKYGIDQILASIFVRRGITQGKDIMYYLEDDFRFTHQAFLLPNMEDAVERILQAKEEEEKVLIFGDSDVDGITSTAILYNQLKNMGIETYWKVPCGDEPYGLTIDAVKEYAQKEVSLIITVDCGISCFDEVAFANQMGIDVIVTDHHNPQEKLPEAILIIDPKLEDSTYPFKDISGAAVAFKLASALRYSSTDFYDSEIAIFDICEDLENNRYLINCLKIKNNVKIKEISEVIEIGKTSIYDLRFPQFLQSTMIYAWDAKKTKDILRQIFGSNIDFNIYDLHSQVESLIPSIKNKSILELQEKSLLTKYEVEEKSRINTIYNIYLSFCRAIFINKYPKLYKEERYDLQLVALSSLADIMPMKNENRIFVKKGVESIKKDGPRPGLAELFIEMGISTPGYENLNSLEMSWKINPVLNSTGRLGHPDISVKLLLSQDSKERVLLAKEVIALNDERKNLVLETAYKVQEKAKESIEEHQNKVCLVVDPVIKPGLTGLFANKLMSDFNLPAIAITFSDDICIGSIRSKGTLIATDFLNSFGDFFINHGGHNFAAGFSFERGKLEAFLQGVKERLPQISENLGESQIEIDAEIPSQYFTEEVFNLIDIFEPYGNENSELTFLTKEANLFEAEMRGSKAPYSLKMNFNMGKIKVPAMLWNQGERLNNDIKISQNYDIIYKISKNYFRGNITKQFEIIKI
ncbi:MAG: single-stranded-DNA-specific exonuclease RecJ [Treponema sp.]|nr:single-stranded-DNA-specific exonuclease RecJ [Treponema sp.]